MKHLDRAWVVKDEADMLHGFKKFIVYRKTGLVKEHTYLTEDFILGIKQKLFKGKAEG